MGAPVAVEPLKADGLAEWDGFAAAQPGASFFHRSGWREVITSAFGHDAHYLVARREGAIVGVLPLIHVESRLFGRSLCSLPFCVEAGPLAVDAQALAALADAAVAMADRLDVDSLEFRSRIRTTPAWPAVTDLYATFIRDLPATADEVLTTIPRKQRAVVRKALSSDLVVRTDPDIDRFYDVYACSLRNLGTPVFGRGYLRKLAERFGADLRVTMIERNGRAISGVLTFSHRGVAMPYYGGGAAEARALGAADLMYYHDMLEGVARGETRYDFGRSKAGTGAFAFKKNWGFSPEFLTYEYYLRRGGVPQKNPLNPKYRLLIAAWRRLPLAVANRIGPILARSLG